MLSTLVAMSNHYGADPDFVLAGGGNTSYKDAQHLYIKGSGTTLATITAEGFVKMERCRLAAMLTTSYPADAAARERQVLQDMMDARAVGEEHKRPSVETLLHDLFAYTYVVHTHPSLVNGLTCGARGKEIARELFGDRIIWIDCIEPGYVLAMTLYEKMKQYKAATGQDADVILLQNHGLFVAADTQEGIAEKTAFVVEALRSRVSQVPDLTPVEQPSVQDIVTFLEPVWTRAHKAENGAVATLSNVQVLRFTESKAAFEAVSSAYSPDHIVYCRPYPLYIPAERLSQAEEEIAAYTAHYGYAPKVLAVPGLGCFAWGPNEKTASIAAVVFQDACKIAVYTQAFGGPLFMSESMIDFIVNWEVESYRSKMSEK